MKRKLIIVLLSSVLGLSSSCSKFLEDYSQDLSKVEGWKDLDELLLGDGYMKPGATTSVNSRLGFNNPNLLFLHFMADELEQNPSDNFGDSFTYLNSGGFGYYAWQQDTGLDKDGRSISGTEAPWNLLYRHINASNVILSQVDEQQAATEEDRLAKERIKGEASFLRAAYYFLLANLYAAPYDPNTAEQTKSVPLKLSAPVEDAIFERASLKTIYMQVLKDLDEAERLLANKKSNSVYRANLRATWLLKSRVYLYMQDYERAAQYAQKVLDNNSSLLNLASVVPDKNVLTKNSPETIFSMGGYVVSSIAYLSASRQPGYVISKDLEALYTANDYRLGTYIKRISTGRTVFIKVSGKSDSWNKPFDVSDCFLFRTSEAYLTLAEASALMNDESKARATLTTFLASRMKTAVNLNFSGNELIDFIRNERAREFCLEGHRWFDLRRYTVSNVYKWSKEIEHGYTEFNYKGPIRTRYYVLRSFDKAYTLDIPRAIVNFQPSLGEMFRPSREVVRVINY